MFNKCIDAHAADKKLTSHIALRKVVMRPFKTIPDDDDEHWMADIPYDTLQLAVKEFAANVRACNTKMAKRQITHYDFKKRAKTDKSQHFWINAEAIVATNRGLRLFPRRITDTISVSRHGKKELKTITNAQVGANNTWSAPIAADSQIVRDRGIYYLITSYQAVNTRKRDTSAPQPEGFIAIDPGVRTFLTAYSENGIHEFGVDFARILRELHERIDVLKELTKTNSLNVDHWSQRKRHLKYKIRKLRAKVRGIVSNFHYQTASWITDHFSCVLLPTYRVSQMVRNGPGALPRAVRKSMLSLSFYKFTQKLEHLAALKAPCRILRCSESYTTRTCGNCGEHHIVGSEKIFACPKCEYVAGRDWNAARNILIRCLTIYSDASIGDRSPREKQAPSDSSAPSVCVK